VYNGHDNADYGSSFTEKLIDYDVKMFVDGNIMLQKARECCCHIFEMAKQRVDENESATGASSPAYT